MSARYWLIPFGTTGDKTPIPNTLQPDGAVSAPIGWGPNYEKEKTEAGYLPVSRTYTNQFAFDVTSGLKDLQDFGAPAYYPEAAPYAINAQVRHDDKLWRSTVANNSTVPGAAGANWVDVTKTVIQATESAAGIAKIATQVKVNAGVDDEDFVTSAKLAVRLGNLSTSDGIAGSSANLKVSTTGTNSKVLVTADAVCVKNSDGLQKVLSAINLNTLDLAASGLNGLDTGSATVNTWYSVWVIWNPTTGVRAGLLSTSLTSPSLPVGFTYKARVSAVRSDSNTTNKYPLSFSQVDSFAQYKVAAGSNLVALPIASAGSQGNVSTPVWFQVPLGNYTPPTARRVRLVLCGGSSGSVLIAAPNNNYGGYQSIVNPPPILLNGSQLNAYADIVLESSSVYYASNSGGNALVVCFGWEDSI